MNIFSVRCSKSDNDNSADLSTVGFRLIDVGFVWFWKNESDIMGFQLVEN